MNVRKDFPMMEKVTYLDSAATSLTPKVVVDRMSDYYTNYNANVHRAIHKSSQKATDEYDASRVKIAEFLNAERDEIIFTSGSTESLNLVARGLAKDIGKGDNVVITEMEHHANMVPWQQFAREKGFELRYISVENGVLDMDAAKKMIDSSTKVVAFCHVSNFLGTINPVNELVTLAKEVGAKTILDASQSVQEMSVDVKKLNIDFLTFSAHKMLGPNGVGILYGKRELLYELDPLLYGGEMIDAVTFEGVKFAKPPEKFEAGTPNISGVIGVGAAVDYLNNIGMENIHEHLKKLVGKTIKELKEIGAEIYGPQDVEERGALVSFNLPGIHSHDVAAVLDDEGVAIRTGHHCVMPLHTKLGIENSCRASFYVYNNEDDVDKLISALKKAKEVLL